MFDFFKKKKAYSFNSLKVCGMLFQTSVVLNENICLPLFVLTRGLYKFWLVAYLASIKNIPCSQLVSHPHTSPTCSFGVWGGWGGGGWLTSCEQGVKEGSHTLYYFWIRTTHTIVNTIVNKTETGWNQLKLESKTRLSSQQPRACTIVIKTVAFW